MISYRMFFSERPLWGTSRAMERVRVRAFLGRAPHAPNRALTTTNSPCTHSTYTPRLPTMEDTTMLDDSKGLFADSSFTIIPNGLSEDRINQVSAPRACIRHYTDKIVAAK